NDIYVALSQQLSLLSSPNTSLSSMFFKCSGDPQALHSFPTRRSSDLGGDLDDRLQQAQLQGARGVGHGASGLGELVRGGQFAVGDRKSTRLNSSHVAISYAVFCLKKKSTDYRAE